MPLIGYSEDLHYKKSNILYIQIIHYKQIKVRYKNCTTINKFVIKIGVTKIYNGTLSFKNVTESLSDPSIFKTMLENLNTKKRKLKRNALTGEQKKKLCLKKQMNPKITGIELAHEFNIGEGTVSVSYVKKISG